MPANAQTLAAFGPVGLSGLGLRLLPDSYAKHLNEPFAAGVIYPAVAAAWVYLGLYKAFPIAAVVSAVLAFLLGFVVIYKFNKLLDVNGALPRQQ